MTTVAFATLGCRLNQVDTQQIQSRLEARGFQSAPPAGRADVVVVNTCTVTSRAEFSDRQAIRRAARANPGARLVVTGCWAQTSPEAVAGLPGVDLVVGNADKDRISELIERLISGDAVPKIQVGDIGRARAIETAPPGPAPGRSRAFLKIQDGCQHRCAFCIVPLARGTSRSLEPKLVLDRVRLLVEAGHPEVVLTGVDLGHYGADLVPRATLAELVDAIGRIEGLRWLRLSSVLSRYFTEDLLRALADSPVIAPHFHVPLQSGSDRVLRSMRRPYTLAMYRVVVERLAALAPRVAIGADVIAGFPGETDADFEATLGAVRSLPLFGLHVFPYSDRQGTEAADRAGRFGRMARPDGRVIRRRVESLRRLAAEKGRAFRQDLVGRVEEVLVLEARDRATGGLVGLTGNYVEVIFEGPDTLLRRLARLRVTTAAAAVTRGVLVEPAA
ncbi:MAG: tRNA (N(6)-L-threonylcarbamoyladenosine(37)-C(2))-methylthiotransferase MtaB [Candidatus Rokuibacteriota bacterium]